MAPAGESCVSRLSAACTTVRVYVRGHASLDISLSYNRVRVIDSEVLRGSLGSLVGVIEGE